MSKKYNDVRINSIERNMKNNPLEYLDYINKNKNEEEILKVLKYSGFLLQIEMKHYLVTILNV
ncbi:hypothetical protein HMPREF0424_0730 [Gardnerella vaginalis 409-05]|nr:hypothetical protein HMPREF0424_0730 [Gardnerella vaginalis 409-05]